MDFRSLDLRRGSGLVKLLTKQDKEGSNLQRRTAVLQRDISHLEGDKYSLVHPTGPRYELGHNIRPLQLVLWCTSPNPGADQRPGAGWAAGRGQANLLPLTAMGPHLWVITQEIKEEQGGPSPSSPAEYEGCLCQAAAV